ncbi:MAG: 23S rRNA (pseudouridine(1915)-N(3))-methyltransferase RlmH [Bergeyella sp.]|nr:23S rRNA (pseudouridine(1915)-N(3))-methyltransferase RlmH [Bergeyella sp.]
MKIYLISVGKTENKNIKDLILYYKERLPKYWNFEMIEIPNRKSTQNLSIENLKKEEGKSFFSHLDPSSYTILLDEKGKEYTSRQFASRIENLMISPVKKINILIGGAYGFSEEIYEKSHENIALSKMTFTHQMVRLFIMEQLYRASQILGGKPYHHEG